MSRPRLLEVSSPAAPVHRRQSMRAEAAGLVAEHHVLADREVRAEVDLLVDGADAGGLRVGRACENALRLAADDDRAGVDRVDAGERLDQRRLARRRSRP